MEKQTSRVLKTVEQVNEERRVLPVYQRTFTIEPKWLPTGIASGFGGEILEMYPRPFGLMCNEDRIKCSKTGRKGTMTYDGSIRGIIKKVEWDSESQEAEKN